MSGKMQIMMKVVTMVQAVRKMKVVMMRIWLFQHLDGVYSRPRS